MRWQRLIESLVALVPALREERDRTLRAKKQSRLTLKKTFAISDVGVHFGSEDAAHLKASLITLSLQMLSTGVRISRNDLADLKFGIAGVLGFSSMYVDSCDPDPLISHE